MTLGLLLKDLRNHDATRKLANNTGAKATGPLEVGSAGMHYVLAAAKFHEDANCVWTAIMARPGIGRIQAICEAETGRFDSETLKIIRGRLCVSLNVEPSAVDAMGLERFADAWRSMNGPPNEVAASRKPESPVELPTGKVCRPSRLSMRPAKLSSRKPERVRQEKRQAKADCRLPSPRCAECMIGHSPRLKARTI